LGRATVRNITHPQIRVKPVSNFEQRKTDVCGYSHRTVAECAFVYAHSVNSGGT
jgi:hypothetical protein